MLPWILASTAILRGQMMSFTQTVSLPATSVMKTLELVRTDGIQARAGDRVTIGYTVWANGKKIADTELLGVPFTFVMGAKEIPEAFDLAVQGLQKSGYRKAVLPLSTMGDDFKRQHPGLEGEITLEVRVVSIVRPPSSNR